GAAPADPPVRPRPGGHPNPARSRGRGDQRSARPRRPPGAGPPAGGARRAGSRGSSPRAVRARSGRGRPRRRPVRAGPGRIARVPHHGEQGPHRERPPPAPPHPPLTKEMSPPMNPRNRIAAVGVVAAGALLLAGCATSGSGENDSESEPQEVSTEITDEDVNLVLAYVDDPPTPALVEGFEEEYPNVTIDAQQTDFGNYITSITRSMSSDDAPDLAQYNPGAMRSLIPAGEVLDLSAYYDAYGWDEAFPQASLDQLMSDDEAMQFATGSLYAAPGALSVLGVFYNKDLLADAGIDSPPQSLAELEEALAAVQDNGDQPLSVGGLEVGGFQLWNLLLNSTGDTQEYLDWVYGAPDSTIETDAAQQAAQTISDWVDEGYISPSANATADSDALAEFTAGESAFLVTGNWSAATIDDELGDAGGFFILPREGADEPPV